MIQRIQTIYLFLGLGALGGQFGLPYAAADAGSPALADAAFADGAYNVFDQRYTLLALTGIALLTALVAIFLFKNRQNQARLVWVGAISAVVLTVAVLLHFFFMRSETGLGGVEYRAGVGLPVLATVFMLLARRAIRSDDKLVRSMDRLR